LCGTSSTPACSHDLTMPCCPTDRTKLDQFQRHFTKHPKPSSCFLLSFDQHLQNHASIRLH
ncbi:hypothetical protein ILYODFUR_033147, partial [Ilyodon furcidens]